MESVTEKILYLATEQGDVRGVVLAPDLWEKVKDLVMPFVSPPEEKLPPEPLQDWETLLQYWDFKYPPDYAVHCDVCGESTEDWRADEPRKFRLTACNLGGLVRFQCMKCKAKITKRHFKNEVKLETQPYVAEKTR